MDYEKLVFGPVTKAHGFYIGDHGFKTHKVRKSSVIYIWVWKCIECLTSNSWFKKNNNNEPWMSQTN